jgi:hypothetical protein
VSGKIGATPLKVNNNKIYSIFIALALIYWNPISYFLFYSNTPVYCKPIYFLHWIIFITGILFIFLIQKNKLNETIKNIVFMIAFVGIFFSSLVVVDKIIGIPSVLKKGTPHTQKQVRCKS